MAADVAIGAIGVDGIVGCGIGIVFADPVVCSR